MATKSAAPARKTRPAKKAAPSKRRASSTSATRPKAAVAVAKPTTRPVRLTVHPLTAARWADAEALFGPKGACAGCWCQWWRRPASEWTKNRGDGNRKALRALAGRKVAPGLIAYAGKEPIGWCAVAPRSEYVRIEKSRVLKPIDDAPAWAVTCFYVAKEWRRRGVTVFLLEAAARFAAKHGARLLEGYPVAARSKSAPGVFVFTGLPSAFEQAGFAEVARRSDSRPIMRRVLKKD
jgi:GNAT superfamily N-acetyltransferase